MALLRWQWTLANGGTIAAVIDTAGQTETVGQGSRVLSQCPRGNQPEGHTILVAQDRPADLSERPPIEAVVSFDPKAPICILRVDGHEVSPNAWPVRERPAPPPEERSKAAYGLLALLGFAIAGAAVWMMWVRGATSPEANLPLAITHRAPSGLFVAHASEDLQARPAVLPTTVSGTVLENKTKTLAIVIAAQSLKDASARDPWSLQQHLRDEALVNVKGATRFEESARHDETCLGERGAVIVGQLLDGKTPTARVWSCAFVHDGAGYLVLHMLAEPVSATTERRARSIVDATELTHLADLTPASDTSGLSR